MADVTDSPTPVPAPVGPAARRVSGFVLILAATAVAGVASYAAQTLVYGGIDAADYATFAAFWSFIYLVVSALGGIQQEVTRGTREQAPDATPQVNRARNFGLAASAVVFIAIVVSAPIWVSTAFPDSGWAMVWPLAVGTASFVMVAVLCGSLYGISQWGALAALMSADAVLRLIALVIVVVVGGDTLALAWAIALPFPAAVVLLWPFIRRSLVGRTQLDVGYRAVTWNVARTMVAAVSTGIMVSGFPLLLQLTSASEPKSLVGLYVFCITLARAPLIVVAMSLQSYFIVMFRNAGSGFWRPFLRLQGVMFAGGIALAGLAWWLGPPVYDLFYPDKQVPDGSFLAVLVLSSALVGSLCLAAPAVLARSEHVVYAAGWGASAVVTVAMLLLPLDFGVRTVLSLLVGPVAGLVVYGWYLLRAHRSDRALG